MEKWNDLLSRTLPCPTVARNVLGKAVVDGQSWRAGDRDVCKSMRSERLLRRGGVKKFLPSLWASRNFSERSEILPVREHGSAVSFYPLSLPPKKVDDKKNPALHTQYFECTTRGFIIFGYIKPMLPKRVITTKGTRASRTAKLICSSD